MSQQQNKETVQYLYDSLSELKDDMLHLKEKIITDNDYNYTQFKHDKELLVDKRNYLEEKLRSLLIVNLSLSKIKNNPKQVDSVKSGIIPKRWKTFSTYLEDYEWLPFEGEICETCGRTHTETTSIAAVILPTNKNLEIICNRCFNKLMKDFYSKEGVNNAAS